MAEVWIIGSSVDGENNTIEHPVPGGEADKATLALRQNNKITEATPSHVDNLLNMAKSIKPTERAIAIGALLAAGRKDDPDINAVLERALADPDVNVRVQAISSLSHRQGSAANNAIQEALYDESADVRMMAVDGIIDDVALLQQAINDSDESIRSLAEVKLEQLAQDNK